MLKKKKKKNKTPLCFREAIFKGKMRELIHEVSDGLSSLLS